MIQVLPTDITSISTEFADTDQNVIAFYIDLARQYVNEGRWGLRAKQGIMLMAMHLMSRFGVNDAEGDGQSMASRGPVISETVGGISTTYAQPFGSVDGSTLSLTPYGEQFNLLRRTIVKTPLVT